MNRFRFRTVRGRILVGIQSLVVVLVGGVVTLLLNTQQGAMEATTESLVKTTTSLQKEQQFLLESVGEQQEAAVTQALRAKGVSLANLLAAGAPQRLLTFDLSPLEDACFQATDDGDVLLAFVTNADEEVQAWGLPDVDAEVDAMLEGVDDSDGEAICEAMLAYHARNQGRFLLIQVPVEQDDEPLGQVSMLLTRRDASAQQARTAEAFANIQRDLSRGFETLEADFNAIASERLSVGVDQGIFAGVASVLLGLLCAVLIARSVSRPVGQMVEVLGAVGEGDLTPRLPDRSDELGSIATSLNTFLDQLTGVIGNIRDGAQEVSCASAELTDCAEQLQQGANSTRQLSGQVACATEELSTNGLEIRNSAERMRAEIKAASESVTAVTDGMSEVAGRLEQNRATSQEARSVASENGREMEMLGEAAPQISQVIETIQEIAEQTNLLALNATIEAARAGAAGKGFAVVASEVKELARQAGEATADIRNRVENMSNTAERAVQSSRAIAGVVDGMLSASAAMEKSVEQQLSMSQEIGTRVSSAAEIADSVGRSVDDSASGTEEITANMQKVDKGAQETAAASNQAATSGQQLMELSQRLDREIAWFKV